MEGRKIVGGRCALKTVKTYTPTRTVSKALLPIMANV